MISPARELEQRQLPVACQRRDGTTSLPRVWDHLEVSVSILEVSVSIAGLGGGVNFGARGEVFSLPV
jgi:hypothetical protein